MSENGQLSAEELVTVEDNDQLAPRAAKAYRAMKAAAAKAGRAIYIVEPAGAYRSYAVQVDIRDHPERYNLNPASKVKIAPPGSSSHGWGDRVDIGGDLAWVIANAARFGFHREFGATDPNHFKHDGSILPAALDLEPLDDAAPTPQGDVEMILVQRPKQGTDPARTFALAPGWAASIEAGAERLGLPVQVLDDNGLNQTFRIFGIRDGIWPAMMASVRAGDASTTVYDENAGTGLRRAHDGRVMATSGPAAPRPTETSSGPAEALLVRLEQATEAAVRRVFADAAS